MSWTNYNENKKQKQKKTKKTNKKTKQKNTSELVFPIFQKVKPSFFGFGGFNENTDRRYNMYMM